MRSTESRSRLSSCPTGDEELRPTEETKIDRRTSDRRHDQPEGERILIESLRVFAVVGQADTNLSAASQVTVNVGGATSNLPPLYYPALTGKTVVKATQDGLQ